MKFHIFVLVAQWIEHLVADEKVVGSNPAEDARFLSAIVPSKARHEGGRFLSRAQIFPAWKTLRVYLKSQFYDKIRV